MTVFEILGSALVGLIISAVWVLTQVAKIYISDRYIPLFGFLVGFVLTFVIFGFSTDIILPAILIGGAGLGIYDVGKKTVLNK